MSPTAAETTPGFGAVKLNKILFYADFEAYRALGQSITGATYQHLAQGPAPKELVSAKRELADRGELVEEPSTYLNRAKKRLIPQRPPNTELIQAEQLRILDQVIRDLWNLNGDQVS